MLRDMEGNIIPSGKTKRTLEETFLYTKDLPGWMELKGNGIGTPSFEVVGIAESYGYLELQTGENINSSSILHLLPKGVSMEHINEVIFELDSVSFSTDYNMEFAVILRDDSNQNGFSFFANRGVVYFDVRSGGSRTDKNIAHYPILRLSEFKRRRNLRLSVRKSGLATLFEGDIVVAQVKFEEGQMDLSKVLYPRVMVKTHENKINYLRVSRIALTIVHN